MNMKRNTLQRQIILDTIKSLDMHPTTEELYLEIQKKHPVIGKSTIYRNLKQLAEDGAIKQIVMDMDGIVRYDKSSKPHNHFICDICGKIFDVDIDLDSSAIGIIESKYGLKTSRHAIEFFGVCSNCNVL